MSKVWTPTPTTPTTPQTVTPATPIPSTFKVAAPTPLPATLNQTTSSPNLLSKAWDLVGNVTTALPKFVSGTIKSMEKRGYENNLRPETLLPNFSDFGSGIKDVVQSKERGLSPWSSGFTGDNSLLSQRESQRTISTPEKAALTAGEIAFPTTWDLGLVKGLGAAGKFISDSKFGGVVKDIAGKVIKPVIEEAKNTPIIYKAIEKVYPAFRTPEAGKIMDEATQNTLTRINDLNRKITLAFDGFTPSQQKRIGQLMQGGISVSDAEKPLLEVAQEMNKIADKIGQEGVDIYERTGGKFGLSPAAYDKFRGQYMPHISTDILNPKEEAGFGQVISNTPSLKGEQFKHRTGSENYIREAAPATFIGLGKEIGDIETAKGYLKIAEKYGVPAEKLTSPTDIVAGAINTLLREGGKTAKKGIGEAQGFAGQMSDNISNYLLDVFKEKLPASVEDTTLKQIDTTMKTATGKTKNVKEWQRVATKADEVYKSLVNSEITGKSPQAIEKWVRKNGAAYQALFGTTPDETHLRVIIEKVGELPDVHQMQKFLDVKNASRLLQDGLGYGAEDISRMNVGKLFTDTALPQEVIDYINKTQDIPKKNIFDDMLNMWKAGKTIYNPAYHVRNVLSNQILSDMSTGKGLLQTVIDYVKSVIQYTGGGTQEFVRGAEDSGLIRANSFYENSQKLLKNAKLVDSKTNFIQDFGNFWKTLQNHSEETAKLNVFTVWVKKIAEKLGVDAEQALKNPEILKAARDKAEEAIFSPYRIGAGERALVARIIPFYSFARQALPFTVKTLVEHPERLTKYTRFKKGIEDLSPSVVPDEQRADWQKGSIQTPFKYQGKPVAVDTTYLYPFGNFGEMGGDNGQLPFGLSMNPLAMEAGQQVFNKDLYFDKPVTDNVVPGFDLRDTLSVRPTQSTSQRVAHAARAALPTVYTTLQGKIIPAMTGQTDYQGRARSKIMSMLDALGIKTTVIDTAMNKSFSDSDKRATLKAIRSKRISITRDQTKTPAEKNRLLRLLDKTQREVSAQ